MPRDPRPTRLDHVATRPDELFNGQDLDPRRLRIWPGVRRAAPRLSPAQGPGQRCRGAAPAGFSGSARATVPRVGGVLFLDLPGRFFFWWYGDLRDLHSFPTRRSSD